MLQAAAYDTDTAVCRAAMVVRYLSDGDSGTHRTTTIALFRTVTEPIRQDGAYDFAASDLVRRMGERLVQLRMHEQTGRLPPPDVLFLLRKPGGLYLQLNRLRAVLPVNQVVNPFLS